MYASLHLIWFDKIYVKYVKTKPPLTMIGKKWIQKRIKCSICYRQNTYFLKIYKAKTKRKRSGWVKPWLKNRTYTSAFIIFAELMVRYLIINKLLCIIIYFFFFFCLIEWSGCLILNRASSSSQIAINSKISLWVHSLLPLLLLLFDIRLLPKQHEDVKVFTTDAVLRTATCFWLCTRLFFGYVRFFLMSLCKICFLLLQTHLYTLLF